MFPGVDPRHAPPRLLVVVAHPDDETFGCGSVLLAAAAAGWHTAVLCATRGEAGEPRPGTDLSVRSLGEVREGELRSAAALMGVADVRLLGLLDSGMEGSAAPGSLAAATPERMAEDVRRVVIEVDPDVLLTLDGGDGHRDHVAVRDATASVGAERDLPVFLQCLPRSLMDRWVEWMAERQPELVYLRTAGLGTPDDEVTVTLDSSAHLEARERAIATHRSQTSPFEGLPDDLRQAFLASDHLRRVG